MKPLPRLAACLLFLLAARAGAQDAAAEKACRAYANVPIPRTDIGTASAGCDSGAPYYTPDPGGEAGVRACAYRQRAKAEGDGPFTGSAILMMIYANGFGVARNIPLAKRFACEIEGPETAARLRHLDAIARKAPSPPLFDVCDDAATTYLMGVCSFQRAGFAHARLWRREHQLMAVWTREQQNRFADLRRAAEAFFVASASGEVDQTGSGRDVFVNDAREAYDEGFLEAINRFEKGTTPGPGVDDVLLEDGRLNLSYQHWLRKLDAEAKAGDVAAGSVTARGVREAQRKWIIYREAWVTFGAARFPDVPADAWRAWVTHDRARWLQQSFEGE